MAGGSRDKVQRLSPGVLWDAVKTAPKWLKGSSPQLLWFMRHYWALPALLGCISFLLCMSASPLGIIRSFRMMSISAGSLMPFIITLLLFTIAKAAFICCQIDIAVLEFAAWCNLVLIYLPIYSLMKFTLAAPCSLGRRVVLATGLMLAVLWVALPIAVGESPLMGDSHGYQWF